MTKRKITATTREWNTFVFYVKDEKAYKLVVVEQHTDFTGTELEVDFPDGDTSTWESKVLTGLTDQEAVNLIGSKLLEVWQDI